MDTSYGPVCLDAGYRRKTPSATQAEQFWIYRTNMLFHRMSRFNSITCLNRLYDAPVSEDFRFCSGKSPSSRLRRLAGARDCGSLRQARNGRRHPSHLPSASPSVLVLAAEGWIPSEVDPGASRVLLPKLQSKARSATAARKCLEAR